MDTRRIFDKVLTKGNQRLSALGMVSSPRTSVSLSPPTKDMNFRNTPLEPLQNNTASLASENKSIEDDNQLRPTPFENYRPVPYTFRIPGGGREFNLGHARTPPLHIQLDHTLAVIWHLFSPETETQLGIAQLQWALSFLKGVKNSKGAHPKDVAICMQTIEDELIAGYAEMVDSVKPKGRKEKIDGMQSKSETIGMDTSTQANGVSTSYYSNVKRASGDTITKTIPFSINYAEMYGKTPIRVRDLFQAKQDCSEADSKMNAELSNLTRVLETTSSFEATKLSSSREEMMRFLKLWRSEQIGKIRHELRRLHSIENYMGKVDGENFEPFLDGRQVNLLQVGEEEREKKSEDVIKIPNK